MGLKLKELIQVQKIELDSIKGKKIAIDGMNMLFQLLKNPYATKNQINYYDSTQRSISHLYGWLQKVNAFRKYKLDVVVVFDGKPEDQKHIITKDTARDFFAVEIKYRTAMAEGNKKEAHYWANSTSYKWQNILNESKQLLEACGIPVIIAPSEAEAQCAALQRDDIVDFMVSWDFDAMLFGATKFLRSLTFAGRRQVEGKWQNYIPHSSWIDVNEELTRLGISRYQLIDLGILVGNDYFSGIPQLGPKRALAAVKYYNTIEPMMKSHPSLFKTLSPENLIRLRGLFMNPPVRHYNTFPARPHPNVNALTHLLLEEHSLSPERVQKYLGLCAKKTNSILDFEGSSPNTFTPANRKHYSSK